MVDSISIGIERTVLIDKRRGSSIVVRGLSRPLANSMVAIVSSESLGASGFIAGASIAMEGNGRSIAIAGISRPLANGVDVKSIVVVSWVVAVGMVNRNSYAGRRGRGIVAIAGLSFSLVEIPSQSLDTSVGVAGSSIGMVGTSGPIPKISSIS